VLADSSTCVESGCTGFRLSVMKLVLDDYLPYVMKAGKHTTGPANKLLIYVDVL
jgi:hypothetical protein